MSLAGPTLAQLVLTVCEGLFFCFITEIKLSYDVASGSEIMPCNKIDKPLVVYRLTGNVMTSITTLRTIWQNDNVYTPEMMFQSICHMINRI